MDVTAVLMAAHLDILSNVERAFRPVGLPPSLIPALLQMRDNVRHHQPARLKHCGEVVALIDAGEMKVVAMNELLAAKEQDIAEEIGVDAAALLDLALARGGYVVDFWPPRKKGLTNEPATLPDDSMRILASPWSVLTGLKRASALSTTKYNRAVELLGSTSPLSQGAIPEPGVPLYCRGGIAELLASTEVFAEVCRKFDVYIIQSDVEDLRATIYENTLRQGQDSWLAALIERLRDGLESGSYQIFPIQDSEESVQFEHLSGPSTQCLLEIVRHAPSDGVVLWVDDRALQRYEAVGAAPTVGVVEVLQALVGAGELSMDAYYEKIALLRAGNARFIPITVEEILHCLMAAEIEQGSLNETYELGLLRRSLAACLSDTDALQRADTPDDYGELRFIHDSLQSIGAAIIEVWKNCSADEAQIRADWLVNQMYVDMSGVGQILARQHIKRYASLELLTHIMRSFGLSAISVDGQPSARKRYLDWVAGWLVLPRLGEDVFLVSGVADLIKRELFESLQTPEDEEGDDNVRAWYSGFVKDLPEPLLNELKRDVSFMEAVGFTQTIEVEGEKYDLEKFFLAAGTALKGSEIRLTSIDGKEVVLRPYDGDYLVVSASGTSSRFPLIGLGLLYDNMSMRKQSLAKHRRELDVPQGVFEATVAEIASTEDVVQRMRKFADWLGSSAAVYYDNLFFAVANGVPFRVRPPSGPALLRHYRLDGEVDASPFNEALERAATHLVHEEGLLEACERLAGLPVPPPNAVVLAVRELSADERRGFFRELLRRPGSLLATLHLIRLLWMFREESAAYRRLALQMSRRVLRNKETNEFRAFCALLNFVDVDFARWHDTRDWSVSARLAMVWLHSERLYRAFMSTGDLSGWICERFIDPSLLCFSETLRPGSVYRLDGAHPDRLQWICFVLFGLSYSLDNSASTEIEEIQELALGLAFPHQTEHGPVPHLNIIHDGSLARNEMNSFFTGGGSNCSMGILGAQLASLLSRESLEEWVASVLDEVQEGKTERMAWYVLFNVIRELPVYPRLRDKLEQVLLSADLARLHEEDSTTALVALKFSAVQSVFLGSKDVSTHLRDQWLKVLAQLSGEETWAKEEENDVSFGLLLDTAYHLALSAAPPSGVLPEFADLLHKLSAYLPNHHARTLTVLVRKFCREMPPAESRFFWPLLVRMRAV